MKNYQTSEFKAKVKRLSINQSPNLRFELFTEMFPTENFQKILIRENEFCSFEESPLGLFCANEKCGQKPFENKIIMCRGKQGFHRGTLRHRVRIFEFDRCSCFFSREVSVTWFFFMSWHDVIFRSDPLGKKSDRTFSNPETDVMSRHATINRTWELLVIWDYRFNFMKSLFESKKFSIQKIFDKLSAALLFLNSLDTCKIWFRNCAK